jgi:hypothetical protein
MSIFPEVMLHILEVLFRLQVQVKLILGVQQLLGTQFALIVPLEIIFSLHFLEFLIREFSFNLLMSGHVPVFIEFLELVGVLGEAVLNSFEHIYNYNNGV